MGYRYQRYSDLRSTSLRKTIHYIPSIPTTKVEVLEESLLALLHLDHIPKYYLPIYIYTYLSTIPIIFGRAATSVSGGRYISSRLYPYTWINGYVPPEQVGI